MQMRTGVRFSQCVTSNFMGETSILQQSLRIPQFVFEFYYCIQRLYNNSQICLALHAVFYLHAYSVFRVLDKTYEQLLGVNIAMALLR